MSDAHTRRLQAVAAEASMLDESAIPHEHLLVASVTADALAAKFELPRSDVRVIPVTEQNDTYAAVIHTGSGLRRGSWKDMHAPERAEEFRLDIGGVGLDSREGMIFPVYQAMYKILLAEARAKRISCMPDILYEKNDSRYEARTWTWLTGYNDANDEAPIGLVRFDGRVTEMDTRRIYGDFESVRFRPAVIIGQQLVSAYLSVNSDTENLDQ